VVENYQTTTHTPEALMRLTESYTALGVPQEAQRSAAVLGANYPQSRWYQRAYALVQQYPNMPPLRPERRAENAAAVATEAPRPDAALTQAQPEVTATSEPPGQQPAPAPAPQSTPLPPAEAPPPPTVD
jgi:outer membrane protein assembly factor BamD